MRFRFLFGFEYEQEWRCRSLLVWRPQQQVAFVIISSHNQDNLHYNDNSSSTIQGLVVASSLLRRSRRSVGQAFGLCSEQGRFSVRWEDRLLELCHRHHGLCSGSFHRFLRIYGVGITRDGLFLRAGIVVRKIRCCADSDSWIFSYERVDMVGGTVSAIFLDGFLKKRFSGVSKNRVSCDYGHDRTRGRRGRAVVQFQRSHGCVRAVAFGFILWIFGQCGRVWLIVPLSHS